MKLSTIGWTVLAMGVVAGCATGSGEVQPDPQADATPHRRYRPGERPVDGDEGGDGDKGVDVQLQTGYLNQADVDAKIDRYTPDLIACYERAGEARKYASGKVRLRFLVARTGVVKDVLVVGNQLGNYPVERCLVVEGRKIPFPAPGGGKDADFEYTIEFRSTGESRVVDWSADAVHKDVSARMGSLASCGPPSEEEVRAVAYIQPGGTVPSVGLVSRGRLDIMNAMCVVEQIRRWRLSGDGVHLVRATFPVHVRATAAGAETHRKTRRVAARRRGHAIPALRR